MRNGQLTSTISKINKFSILNLRATASVFPAADRQRFPPNKRTRNGRRSHNFRGQNQKLLMQNLEPEKEVTQIISTNMKALKQGTKDEDSDLYAVSDSNREAEEKTNRYVGKAAFNHYYNNYK